MPEGTTDVTLQTAEGAGTQVTGAPTGAAPQAETTAGERKFTQAEVNAMVRKDVDSKLAKLKADADEKAALEAGKFQELAEQRQARIAEIEPQLTTVQERLVSYEEAITTQVKERRKALPEELRTVLDLLPDDALSRFNALPAIEALAQRQSIARSPGTPAGPTGSGGTSTPHTTVEEIAARKRASGVY